MNDFVFEDAESPWLPKLCDIEYFKVKSDDPTYWQRFGWEQLAVPDDCDIVASRMSDLKIRFDERYANRMINSETMERWQIRLQNRFDEVVRRYNRLYELYAKYDDDMKNDIIEGEKTTVIGKVTSGGQDTTTGKGRSIDTPDEAINETAGYAGSRTDSEGTTKYGRTDSTDMVTERIMTGMRVVDSINTSTRNWSDIDTEFVKEFEDLFLNILWC